MEIENYLRAMAPDPKEPQDHFAEGVEVNSQEAILETSTEGAGQFELDLQKYPEEISLLVTLLPTYLRDVIPEYRFEFRAKGASDGVVSIRELAGAARL